MSTLLDSNGKDEGDEFRASYSKEVDTTHFEILWPSVTHKQRTIERPRDTASDVGLEKNRTCKTRVKGKNEMQRTK